MSQQAVLAFREKVKASRDLQNQIRAGAEAKNLDIFALGKAYGCDFTAVEVTASLNEAELSDFELEMVSGAGGKPPWGIGPVWTRGGGRLISDNAAH